MFDIGMSELIVISVVALLVFGPKRLPELARALGKGLAEIKRSLNDAKRQVQTEFRELESQEQGGVAKGFADLKRSLDDVRKQVETGYKQVMVPVGQTPVPKPDENAYEEKENVEEEEEEIGEVEEEEEEKEQEEEKVEKKEKEKIEPREKMEKKEETEQNGQEQEKKA